MVSVMKVVRENDKVVLKPENNFEKEALRSIKERRIKSINWTDFWEQKGNLEIEFISKNEW